MSIEAADSNGKFGPLHNAISIVVQTCEEVVDKLINLLFSVFVRRGLLQILSSSWFGMIDVDWFCDFKKKSRPFLPMSDHPTSPIGWHRG